VIKPKSGAQAEGRRINRTSPRSITKSIRQRRAGDERFAEGIRNTREEAESALIKLQRSMSES
jgi:hypothetical protein